MTQIIDLSLDPYTRVECEWQTYDGHRFVTHETLAPSGYAQSANSIRFKRKPYSSGATWMCYYNDFAPARLLSMFRSIYAEDLGIGSVIEFADGESVRVCILSHNLGTVAWTVFKPAGVHEVCSDAQINAMLDLGAKIIRKVGR